MKNRRFLQILRVIGLIVIVGMIPVVSVAGVEITVYNDSSSLFIVDNTITALAFDDSGYAWIGFNSGFFNTNLVKFAGESSYFLYGDSLNPGLNASWVTSIDFTENFDVWIGTQTQGARRFDRDSTWWEYRPDNSDLADLSVYTVAIGTDDHIWFGFYEAGLSQLTPDSVWSTYQSPSYPMDNSIRDVFVDSDGDIWTAAIGGLYRYDGTAVWTSYVVANSDLPSDTVYSVNQDWSGDYWIGTHNGVCRFDGGSNWTCFTSENSDLAPGPVTSLAIDSNGYVWCGHREIQEERDSVWVSRYDGISWIKINIDNNELVRNISVTCLAADAGGDIWVGTSGEGISQIRMTTPVHDDDHGTLPNDHVLSQNHPNPFNSSTKISYRIPKRSDVTLQVYDILGRKVTTLVNEIQSAGTYSAVWDGLGATGQRVASGIYLYRLSANGFTQTRKMILLK
ncbi:MAG: T9SS type A sorting domain-containing protein [candidate division Zixibacteria bacterium]|nr:T9SS type A sorting domain-containing protein [candidate division Zixibacteria bacterium]